MSIVAQSFGVTDDKSLSHMLAMNANPQLILIRDKTYSTRGLSVEEPSCRRREGAEGSEDSDRVAHFAAETAVVRAGCAVYE